MLSNKNDYDNFEHLKLSIEKPCGQLLCYVQYSVNIYIMMTDRIADYWRVPPPGRKNLVAMEPFLVDDSIPEDE